MFKSLRYRLLAWFLIVTLITTIIYLPLNFYHKRNEAEITNFTNQINLLYIDFLKDFKSTSDFFSFETTNSNFFITGESQFIAQHLNYKNSINDKLSTLETNKKIKSFNFQNGLNRLKNEYSEYCLLFDSIVYKTYLRGYQDYGLKGEMSSFLYHLGKKLPAEQLTIYKIIKNENDYSLGYNHATYDKFLELQSKLRARILQNNVLDSEEKKSALTFLDNYTNTFGKLSEIENTLGLRNNQGQKLLLDKKAEFIENLTYISIQKSFQTQQSLISKLNAYYLIYVSIILFLSIIISLLISKHIVTHLEELNNYISNLTRNNFKYTQHIKLRNATTEIYHIYKEFRNMVAQLHIWEKQRDKALQNAELNKYRYQELTDLLPQSVYETDVLGNFTYVNKAWYNNFGYTEKDIKEGLNLIETLISETGEEILSEGKIENLDFMAIRKNGSQFNASVYSTNIIKDEVIVGRRGIIVDVTDKNQYIKILRKEKAQAQTADMHKSSFLANMSHEIRTPMNSIIGFSNLLASDEVPEDQKIEFISFIKSSGEMLLNLIDDIIDIAKIEAGEIKIKKANCALNELLEEVFQSFNEIKKKLNKDHINLLLNTDNEEQIIIKTDAFRLKQIITNLVGNALKFTDSGSVEFGYNIISESKIEFFVKDTGIGLSREELDMIFERFKRTTITEERNIVGTGLGLAISKNLAELLGGVMWVDSTPNVGTTFYFTLPFIKVHSKAEINNTAVFLEDMINWKNKTFLIVEDDESSYSFLKELLRKTEANIMRAKTGKEAIDVCSSNTSIDIVLMDIQMPEMNGYDATREIKKARNNLPVIAQTAFAMEGDKEKSIMAGCDDYITKPVDKEKLLAKICQFITPKPAKKGKIKEEKPEQYTPFENKIN